MSHANPDSKTEAEVSRAQTADDYDSGNLKEDAGEKRDYSGAVTSTDPAEKALVGKLDWRIMVQYRPTILFTLLDTISLAYCSPFK